MYIVSIKKETVAKSNTVSVIDSLFGEEATEVYDDYYHTQTTELDTNLIAMSDKQKEYITYYSNILSEFLKKHKINKMYTEFKIPKHTGGFRTIDAPNDELKLFMREFTHTFIRDFKLQYHDAAYAYVKKRSVIDAVKQHQNNRSRWFLKIDLKDFFGSCNEEFIVSQLSKVYPFATGGESTINFLKLLAEFSCLNNKLPQGTPISPWLTNLIMIEYDYKITKLLNNIHNKGLKKQRYVYTRYADDILISAKEKFDYQTIIDEIKELFKDTPLTIKDEKTRFGSSAGRNWNLGIMYNKDCTLTIGHKKKRQLKDNIYYFIKFKDNFSIDECWWLQGNISWLQSVEPEYTKGLLKYYKDKFDVDVLKEITLKIKSLI